MSVFLDGIALGGYRSFGPTTQYIFPLKKVNLIVGTNNSGKSNILGFLSKHIGHFSHKGQRQDFNANLDDHQGNGNTPLIFGISRPQSDPRFDNFLPNDAAGLALLRRVLQSAALSNKTDRVWFLKQQHPSDRAKFEDINVFDRLATENVLDHDKWYQLWKRLFPGTNGGSLKGWMGEVIQRIRSLTLDAPHPRIELIPAIRRVGDAGSNPDDFSGLGIIDRLAQLQNPDHVEQEKKQQFASINAFVQQVTGNASAALEIPYSRDKIVVRMDGKFLPLSSMGTGFHEVVILAAAATMLTDQILCVEEPELHLHPSLQRKLLRYLESKTSNQYFISTHSAHLLDSPNAAVFHVRLEDGQSVVTRVIQSSQQWSICRDLGCKASDLVQANCIVWVEGPSDRVYLNHWIRAVDDSLVEGLHYSIMFYGGRLLAHLSAQDPEITDFISLVSLNRNVALVMDSDKSSPKAEINLTKKRVRDEVAATSGYVWVTEGREIENYVDATVLRESVETVKAGFGAKVKTGKFKRVLPSKSSSSELLVDKLKVAHEVSNRSPVLTGLDLKLQVERLVDFIRLANG